MSKEKNNINEPQKQFKEINDENEQLNKIHKDNSDIMIPFNKLSSFIVDRLRTEQTPQIVIQSSASIEDAAYVYFKQYAKLFRTNQQLNNELVDVISDRNLLAEKFNQLKKTKSSEEAVRRKRRYARDIQRLFFCPIQRCKRGYGSEGSLSHHIRLKHIQFYQSGRYQIFIQNYIDKLPQIRRRLEEADKDTNKKNVSKQPKTYQKSIKQQKARNNKKQKNDKEMKIEQ